MSAFLSAVKFLTIIPFKGAHEERNLPEAMIFFPVVGLLLGLVMAGLNNFMMTLGFDSLIASVLLIIFLIMATGALHLDGLADTSDAMFSLNNDREELLRIMRDHHIGVMGVLSLISVILLKVSLIASLSSSVKALSLILMCVLGRWSMVFSMFLFPYARREGKAGAFIQGINGRIFATAAVITLILAGAILKTMGLAIFAAVTITAYAFGGFVSKRIKGITGDTLGAVSELSEAAVLFIVYFIEKGGL
jgi:adenosylcobinamide-GDP ribazoletransferase